MNDRTRRFVQFLEEVYASSAHVVVDKSPPPAKPLSLTERKKLYRQCHGIAKDYDLDRDRRGYMARHWGKKSMRDLTDVELVNLYDYLRSLEARILFLRR